MSNLFDVAIIGAGPSGTACALALKDCGLKVALIDKDSFPRKKACGDAIPGKAFKAIEYINPKWGNELKRFTKGTKISKGVFYSTKGHQVVKNWKFFSYNCKRIDFDNYLLSLIRKNTSIKLFENNQIVKVESCKEGFHIQSSSGNTIMAKLIIGCDGAHSIIKRKLLSKSDIYNNTAVAVMTYYKNIKGLKPETNEVFHVKKYPNGYFWIFPLQNKIANVGFGVLPDKKTKNKINIKEAFKEIIAEDTTLSKRFDSAEMINSIIGAQLPFGGKRKKISGDRFMLCGDAASLINPLTGAGIDNAIWSGVYAAEQAISCFDSSNFSSDIMLNYDKAVYNNLGKDLRKSYRMMKWITKYPNLVNITLRLIPK